MTYADPLPDRSRPEENSSESEGWEAGVDAEVTLIDVGAQGSVGTLTSQHPVVGFVFDEKGLMAGVSIKGAKFTRINPD